MLEPMSGGNMHKKQPNHEHNNVVSWVIKSKPALRSAQASHEKAAKQADQA